MVLAAPAEPAAVLQVVKPQKLLFLPGAGGDPAFWLPVSRRLATPATQQRLGWPGFGPVPPQADIEGFDDLVRMTCAEITEPCALIAQSMGGAIAVHSALAKPGLVSHLVLTVTSGGVDMSAAGAADWRPAYFAAHPTAPRWFADYREDLTQQIQTLDIPTLLIWGDSDPISPLAVGRQLNALLRRSSLHVIASGGHDLAQTHAAQVAPLIDQHLSGTAPS